MRDTEREAETQAEEEEKQAPCREPDVGLNSGSPGSHPEMKADTQPLSHPGVPCNFSFLRNFPTVDQNTY